MSRLPVAVAVICAGLAAAGCGSDDAAKYDPQYPTPRSEQNMMRVLRSQTGAAHPQPVGQQRKESDTR
jgi:hypothetical protein